MLLHAGAGLHGHEYSSDPPPRHNAQPLADVQQSSARDVAANRDERPPSRPTSQLLPGFSYVSSLLPSPRSLWERPSSDYFIKSYLPTRYTEMGTQSDPSSLRSSYDSDTLPVYLESETKSITATDTERSCDNTCASSQSSRLKRERTRFHFARPAPGTHTKQRKDQPRLLLQLRREHQGRPLPSVEVVPASDIAGSKLKSSDILVMRSDYDRTGSWLGLAREGNEDLGAQDALAVITPGGNVGDGSAEVVLEDESFWLASRLPNGSYEFCCSGEQGSLTVVRWIKRRSSSATADRRFGFCTMDPLVRKHPFLASLGSGELDIFDTYTTPASVGRGSRPASYAGDGPLPSRSDKQSAIVTGAQKRLMLVTAIWVTFCEEGWPDVMPQNRHSRAPLPRNMKDSRRSGDGLLHDEQQQMNRPKSPKRENPRRTFEPECLPACSTLGSHRTPPTGAAYMERRRVSARLQTTTSKKAAEDSRHAAKTQLGRGKLRAWAHRLLHSTAES